MFIDFDKNPAPDASFDLQFQCDHIELNLRCSLELFVCLKTARLVLRLQMTSQFNFDCLVRELAFLRKSIMISLVHLASS
jgi:hypothetical protein